MLRLVTGVWGSYGFGVKVLRVFRLRVINKPTKARPMQVRFFLTQGGLPSARH